MSHATALLDPVLFSFSLFLNDRVVDGIPRQALATNGPTMHAFTDASQDPGEAGLGGVVRSSSGAVTCF